MGFFALAANLAAAFLAGLFLALGLFIAFLGAGAGIAFLPGFFLTRSGFALAYFLACLGYLGGAAGLG